MEARMKKYRSLSPDRAKVWTEKSPKYQQNRKVPVVYYLCRNRQLEHPHFMEVPLSSPEGPFLRDVIDRLNTLRGRGMASLYSWSCKRSYKNGFVWHDLGEADLILPAHGNEYVLKGSELFEVSNSDRFSPIGNIKIHPSKQLPEPASSQSRDDSSSPSSLNGKAIKHSQEEELSPPDHRPGSSGLSPDTGVGKNASWGGSLSSAEYKACKSDGLSDASTQTDENVGGTGTRETCTRGVSTDDRPLEPECSQIYHQENACVKQNYEIPHDSISPPPSSSSTSSNGKTETLESLIRADASKINSSRILEEEDTRLPTNIRLKATNVLMQLISCGSISVKDHSFGLIPAYKPRFSSSKFHYPLFSTSIMLGELECISENRLMGLTFEDKEYFSGSLIESKMLKAGDGFAATLKRSSSYNADRISKHLDSMVETEEPPSGRSKCIPRSIKVSLSKQPRRESMRSPCSDKARISSDGVNDSDMAGPVASNIGSKRITESLPGKKQSIKLDSFREERENVIKIEESFNLGQCPKRQKHYNGDRRASYPRRDMAVKNKKASFNAWDISHLENMNPAFKVIIKKVDEASIVGDAVSYVQELQMQAKKLRSEIAVLEASIAGSERYHQLTENPRKKCQAPITHNLFVPKLIIEQVRDGEKDINLPNLKLWVAGALLNQGFELRLQH